MTHGSCFLISILTITPICLVLLKKKKKEVVRKLFSSEFFPFVSIKGICVLYQVKSPEQRVNFQQLNPQRSVSVFHTSAHSNENPRSNNYISNPGGDRVIYSRSAFYFAINTSSIYMLSSSSSSLLLSFFSSQPPFYISICSPFT